MKRILLLTIFSSTLAIATQAQNVSFGVKAGLNISTVKGDDYDDGSQRSIAGLLAGILARVPITGEWSAQPELLFSMEGTQWKEGSYHETERLNYILLPLAIQYMHARGFFGSTGPQFGYLLSAKEKYKYEGESEVTDIMEDFRRFAFAWFLTVGYQHMSGFGASVRYNLGLSSAAISDYAKAMPRTFNVSLFYMLPKRK